MFQSLRWPVRACLACVALVVGAVVSLSPGVAHAQSAFYDYSQAEAIGAPGSIIRSEPMRDGPDGAQASRILYRSVGVHGEPIAVSGVVIIPAGPAPAGGRPIVAWAHPTSGIVPRCAPSLALFLFDSMQGMKELLAQGYIVVGTDYPGLGTKGPHPYLVGSSEGRAVLDSVRAAQLMPAAQAGNRYALWGHSQGGQAALYAGAMAAEYAPELKLEGVAVAAPATNLEKLLHDDAGTDGGRNITAMTLWSWSRVYGVPTDDVIDPSVMPAVDALANECIESVYDILQRDHSQRPLAEKFLTVSDITQVEPWRSLLLPNVAGTLPPGIPVFIAQGEADPLVLPAVTQAYMKRLCAAGSSVQLLMLPGVGHAFAGRDSKAAAVAWISDRMAGLPAPDACL